jgi:hypothetical protein
MRHQKGTFKNAVASISLCAAAVVANLALSSTALAQTYTAVFTDGFSGNLNNWTHLSASGSRFAYQTTYAGSGEGAVANHATYTGAGWAFCNQVPSQMAHSLGTRPFAQGRVTGYFSDGRSGWKAGICGGAFGQVISLRDTATTSSSVYIDNGYHNTGQTSYYSRNSSTTYTSYGTRCATADCNRRWFKFQTTVTPAAPGSSPPATFTAAVTQAGACTTTLSTALNAASTFFNYGITAVHLGNGEDSTQDGFWDDILFEAFTPAAPTIGTATANSTSQITWAWTKAADHNLFGFDVTDSSGTLKSPDYPATGWIDRADSSWVETGLSANTSYTRKVKAWNGSLNSAYSGTASKWTLSIAPTAGSVTPDHSSVCSGSPVTWTAVGGFGGGKIQKYK